MDAQDIQAPNENFDAALCALGLMYVPDPLASLREMRRVLRELGTSNALALTMELAGFRDVVAERIPTTLAYASGEDACGAAFPGGPVALSHSRFDAPTRAEAETEYLASLAPYRRGDAYEVPGEFVVARGTRAAH